MRQIGEAHLREGLLQVSGEGQHARLFRRAMIHADDRKAGVNAALDFTPVPGTVQMLNQLDNITQIL